MVSKCLRHTCSKFAYLTNGHPLKVRSHSIHLPLVDRNSTILLERLLRVVKTRRAIAVAIIRHFMIVPGRNPRKLSMREKQILISAVCA